MAKSVQGLADLDLHSEIADMVAQLNADLTPENPLSPYVSAYNDMFGAFDNTYQRNVKLVKFCQEMNSIIIMNATRINEILRYSSGTGNSFDALQAEFDDANAKLKSAVDREASAKMEIDELRTQMAEVARRLEEVSQANPDVDEVESVKKDVDDNAREIEMLREQITAASACLAVSESSVSVLKNELEQTDKDIEAFDSSVPTDGSLVDDVNGSIAAREASYNASLNHLKLVKSEVARKREICDELERNLQMCESEVQALLQDNSVIKASASRLPKELRKQTLTVEAHCDRKANFERHLEKLAIEEEEGVAQIRELDEASVAITRELELVSAVRKKVSGEKKAMKERWSQLVSQSRSARQMSTKIDGSNRVANRLLSVKAEKLSKDKMARTEGEHQIHEIEMQQQSLVYAALVKKQQVQGMKEQVARLDSDISTIVTERGGLAQRAEILVTSARSTDVKNAEAADGLDAIRKRVLAQDSLMSDLRQERDAFKIQCSVCKAEHQDLLSKWRQLRLKIDNDTFKIDTMTREINEHTEKKKKIDIVVEQFQIMVGTCSTALKETAGADQKLQTEHRSLLRVHEEIEKQLVQRQRELVIVTGDCDMVQAHMCIKARQIEQLRKEVKTKEAYLRKSAELFAEKMAEINTFKGELNQKFAKMAELHKKERVGAEVELSYRCKFQEYELARTQRMALYYEIETPRIVSVNELNRMCNPELKHNLGYLRRLYRKFAYADVTLRDLQEKRDKILAQATALNEKAARKAMSQDEFSSRVRTYKEHVRDMSQELAEIQRLVNGQVGSSTTEKNKAESARRMITRRRLAAELLKRSGENIVKASQNVEGDEYFVTAPPVVMPSRSCGFKIPSLQLSRVAASYQPCEPQSQRYGMSKPRVKVPAVPAPISGRRPVRHAWH